MPRPRDTRPAVRRLLAVVMTAAALSLAGCGDQGVPYECPWSGAPDGVTAADLTGDYDGVAPGRSLRLDGDGTYTTTGFAYGDWLNGYELEFQGGDGRWKVVLEPEGLGVPFVDVPFIGGDTLETVAVTLDPAEGSGPTDLEIGRTPEAPVLYHDTPLDADTCDAYSSLFRRR